MSEDSSAGSETLTATVMASTLPVADDGNVEGGLAIQIVIAPKDTVIMTVVSKLHITLRDNSVSTESTLAFRIYVEIIGHLMQREEEPTERLYRKFL